MTKFWSNYNKITIMANFKIEKVGTGPEVKMGCTVKLLWRMFDLNTGKATLASGSGNPIDYKMEGDLVWRKYCLGYKEGSHLRYEIDEKGGIGDKYSMFVVILLVTYPENTNLE